MEIKPITSETYSGVNKNNQNERNRIAKSGELLEAKNYLQKQVVFSTASLFKNIFSRSCRITPMNSDLASPLSLS